METRIQRGLLRIETVILTDPALALADRATSTEIQEASGGQLMTTGDTSFPNCSLSSVREAHQRTHSRREALYHWLAGVMVTPGMKGIISGIVKTCLTLPAPPKPPDKDRSDQGDMPWRKLTY